jgi:hypothetical protein
MISVAESVLYQGFYCRAVGKIAGDLSVNAYITTGVNGKPDVVDFYLFSFVIGCESHKLFKKLRRDSNKPVVKKEIAAEKYRVVIRSRNIDLIYMLKPGMIIDLEGTPRANEGIAMRYGNPLYIDCDRYHVIRPQDVVDKDSGEVIRGVEVDYEVPGIRYFIRLDRKSKYRNAGSDYLPCLSPVKNKVRGEEKFGITEIDAEDIMDYEEEDGD